MDSPDLVRRVYEALCLFDGLPEVMSRPAPNKLVLTRKDGKSIWFAYVGMAAGGQNSSPGEKPVDIYLYRNYFAPELAPILYEIERDQSAAQKDATLGLRSVKAIEVQKAGGQRASLPVSSEGGRAVRAKAEQLVDWLDLRAMSARVYSPEDYGAMVATSGAVTLKPESQIAVSVMVWDEHLAPIGWPNPIGTNIRFDLVLCDEISLFHGKSARMPQVGLHDKKTDRYYVSGTYMRRRGIEKFGITHYGWKGRPTTDREYYKEPEVVYAELRELAGLPAVK